MTWKDEVAELAARKKIAMQMGGAEAVDRYHALGKLTVRERVHALLDLGSFHEIGVLAGSALRQNGERVGFVPSPYVMGLGEIDGRPVAVGGQDFTIRGASGIEPERKEAFVEDLALEYKIPLILLLDSAGANVQGIMERGFTYLTSDYNTLDKPMKVMEAVPLVACTMGSVAGGPAGMAVFSHFSVMVKGTSALFAAGPPLVKRALGQDVTKEELGGSWIHTRESGAIHNEAADDADALAQVRSFLSFLPSNVWEVPPVRPTRDPDRRCEEELLTIVPRNRRQPYSMKRLIRLVVDDGNMFEIQPNYGASIITALARVSGYPVGIVANDPNVLGGAQDGNASDKLGHFVELCDFFHIPLVYVVDNPGFMIGQRAERRGSLIRGMRAIWTWCHITVPMAAIYIRKCYGMAGMATSNAARLNYRVAWPGAEAGSIPIEGGVEAAFRREIEAAPDPDARRDELEAEFHAVRDIFATAEAFGVEEIIDPRETRLYLARFLRHAYRVLPLELGPKAKVGVRI